MIALPRIAPQPRKFPRLAAWLVLACTSARIASAGAPSEPALPSAAGPARILAVEDSMHVYLARDTTKVVARRIPLAEIIRKAQEGERHKYDSISTMAFDRTLKVTMSYGGTSPKSRCIESTARVYYRNPDGWAEAPLRENKYEIAANGERKPWTKDKVEINVDDDGEGEARSLTELPEYLQDTGKFDFRIAHRSLRPNQVLYEIAFEPKSDFDILPGGRVWLLTNGYQIVREEYHLKNLPVPWLLESLGLLTREWQQVEGHWVQKRITARAKLRTKLGLGLVKIPRLVEVAIVYDQYRFGLALDEKLFEKKP